MDFGIAIFPTLKTPSPSELAQMVEERGFESLFFPEHTHIPASRESPSPEGEPLPDCYRETYDPFVALSFAASATTSLKIGSAICQLAQRDPIITAKETASLDQLSGGRYILGIGGGWNREEMRNHGTDPRHRFKLMGERMRAIKEIWRADEASFHGDFVDFEQIWCWPKPHQEPGPPVLIGGEGTTVIDRVLEYGDGWMPNRPPGDFEVTMVPRLRELQARAQEVGRAPIPVTMSDAILDPAEIETYPALGVVRCLYWLPSVRLDELIPLMDELAEAVEPLKEL